MEVRSYGQGAFAHELGRNMGRRHDWYMDNSTSPAAIGHGYVDALNGFFTDNTPSVIGDGKLRLGIDYKPHET